MAVHTQKMLSDAPTWPDVYQEYRNVTLGKRLLVYNSHFDKRLLRQTCKQYGLSMPRRSWGCVMLAYGECVGRKRYGEYRWYKLSEASYQLAQKK